MALGVVAPGVAQCLVHFLSELQNVALRRGKLYPLMEKKLPWQHLEWLMELEWKDRGLESVRELCPAHIRLRASPSQSLVCLHFVCVPI